MPGSEGESDPGRAERRKIRGKSAWIQISADSVQIPREKCRRLHENVSQFKISHKRIPMESGDHPLSIGDGTWLRMQSGDTENFG